MLENANEPNLNVDPMGTGTSTKTVKPSPALHHELNRDAIIDSIQDVFTAGGNAGPSPVLKPRLCLVAKMLVVTIHRFSSPAPA